MDYFLASDIQSLHASLPSEMLREDGLMLQAAKATIKLLQQKYSKCSNLYIFCGAGNNAGDGYVLARLAAKKNYVVTIVELGNRKSYSPNVVAAKDALPDKVEKITLSQLKDIPEKAIIVDAILGIGARAPIQGVIKEAISLINNRANIVISLDLPSGLDPNTGRVLGECITANHTITYLLNKVCLVVADGIDKAGEITVAGLVPDLDKRMDNLCPRLHSYQKSEIMPIFKPRKKNSHKGTYPNILVVAGGKGYLGALLLVLKTTAKLGAGVVRVATVSENIIGVLAIFPHAIVTDINDKKMLAEYTEKSTSIIVGPGITSEICVNEYLKPLSHSDKNIILDAGALRMLDSSLYFKARVIFTPHPGEAGCLLGMSASEVQANRLLAAKTISKKFNVICVLKGAGTIISYPNSETADICPYGNPGMAIAGMGDILAATISCLLGQDLTLENPVLVAVYLHALAGDKIANIEGEVGIEPLEVIESMHSILNNHRGD
ncbi:MAG: NAD(P)H-hydrate dehydratase [Pseudomonadota bacterium]|nr:NAD(P)H-hydrate dehydratase [Pseudomonadota bacterium]